MEDVLRVYRRPYDERRPLICMDEGSKCLIAQVHEPLAMEPGKIAREDYEYDRQGTCSVFVAVEPLAGKRIVEGRARRTKADWAYFMRDLIDVHYRHAEKLVIVMDNLNTHTPSSFFDVFEPDEAWRLAEKLEIHHTPIHGSWLNIAEIELSVLARQAIPGRIPTLLQLQEHIATWQEQRNQQHACIQWHFTTADARIKLSRLYPSNEG